MKEKSININIRNTNNNIIKDKKKRKRRSRRSKNSKKKQQALGQPIQGYSPSSVTSYPPYNGPQLPNNYEANKYADDYLIPVPSRTQLLLTNGDEAKTNKNNLMLTNGDEAKSNGPVPSTSKKMVIKQRRIIKGKVLGNIDNNDDLFQMSIINLKALIKKKLKEVGVEISDKELKKINKENKLEKIKYYMDLYNENNIEEVEQFEDEGKKKSETVSSPNEDYTERHTFKDQSSSSSPPFSFETQTPTSNPTQSFGSPTKKPSGLRGLVARSQFTTPKNPKLSSDNIYSAALNQPSDEVSDTNIYSAALDKPIIDRTRKKEKKEKKEQKEQYIESVVDKPIDQSAVVQPVFEIAKNTRSTKQKTDFAKLAKKGLEEAKQRKERLDKSKEISNQGLNYAVMGSPSELNLPTSTTKKNPLQKGDYDRELIKELRKQGMSIDQQSNYFGNRD